MANQSVKSVSTTAVRLSPPDTHSGVDLIIQNNAAAGDLFIGSSTVTSSSYGFKVVPGSAISLRLPGKEEIYGITNHGSAISIATLTLGLA
jgi:hypothetical protein